MRHRLLAVGLMACAGSAVSAADIMWIAAAGNWNTAANWSANNVPDTAGETAVIASPTAVVTLNVSVAPDGVAITDAAARLNLTGQVLTVSPLGIDSTGLISATTGSSIIIGNVSNTGVGAGRGIEVLPGAGLSLSSPIVSNSGRIEINPTNAVAQTFLRADVNTLLTGTGTISMSSPANRAILSSINPAVITQDSMHTIRGMGELSAALTNHGLVSADVNGNVLTLFSQAKTNHGTFRATGGGFMDLSSITVTQGPTGLLLADAGTIRASTLTLSGGSTNTANGGLIQFTAGASTISSITNLGTMHQIGGTVVNVLGTGLLNNGVYTINPGSIVAQTTLQFNVSGDLSGTGTVVMGSPSNRAILATGAGATINQTSGHTIRGMGQLNASIINNGLIEADVAGNTLLFQSNAKTNNAMMRAVSGALLEVNATSITQGAAGVLRGDGGTVRLLSASVSGGTIDSINGGLVTTVSGTSTLNAMTLAGLFEQGAGTTVNITGGDLNNSALYTVNPTNAVAQTILQFNQTGALAGAGTVLLNSPSNRAILATGAGAVVTNSAAHTVRGMGQINASLINDGLISADVPGNVLLLQINGKTNQSIMEAVNGGFLDITAVTIDQSPTAIIAAEGGTVRLTSCAINDGTLAASMGGLITNSGGTSTLNSVSISGDFDVVAGTTVQVTGDGLVNNGDLTVNPTNAVAQTMLQFNTSGSLSGSGILNLNSPSNRAILSTSGGATITHAAGHTIRGRGQITALLVNDSLIQADVPSDVLTLQTNAKTNNSTMKAVGGGFLDLSVITVNQDPAAQIVAENGTVRLISSTVVGGTLASTGTGLLTLLSGTNTLTGVTVEGTMHQQASTTLNINGTGIQNNGLIVINPSNAVAATFFIFTQTGTLSGNGTLLLGSPSNRAILTSSAGLTITNGPQHTIAGIGQILAPTLLNDGIISPEPNGSVLEANSSITMRPGSVLDFRLGSTGGVGVAVLGGTGTINLGGTLRARLINGHVPPPGAVYTVCTTTNRLGRFASFDLPAGTTWSVEYLATAIRLKAAPFCFGDTDFNNSVNFADVTAVLTNFGMDYSPAPGTGPGDSNRDGVVNFADITNVLTFFNATCS